LSGVAPLELSVVVPALNERESLPELVRQTVAALEGVVAFEVIVVDDGSTDDSVQALLPLLRTEPRLRVLSHGRRAGQSVAVASGVRAARAPLVATLDADLQNDPADLRSLWAALQADAQRETVGLVAGQRQRRHDGFRARLASRIGNGVRRKLLRDGAADSACGLKLFPRELFLALPVFGGLHRFLPALVQSSGRRVLLVPVGHRARLAGKTKYGIWNRLWVGIGDLLAVWWLIRRRRHPGAVDELSPTALGAATRAVLQPQLADP